MSEQTIEARPRRSPNLNEAGALRERPQAPFALSWSGGKDSALVLWTLRRQLLEPEALITTVTESYARISMHGVRRELRVEHGFRADQRCAEDDPVCSCLEWSIETMADGDDLRELAEKAHGVDLRRREEHRERLLARSPWMGRYMGVEVSVEAAETPQGRPGDRGLERGLPSGVQSGTPGRAA